VLSTSLFLSLLSHRIRQNAGTDAGVLTLDEPKNGVEWQKNPGILTYCSDALGWPRHCQGNLLPHSVKTGIHPGAVTNDWTLTDLETTEGDFLGKLSSVGYSAKARLCLCASQASAHVPQTRDGHHAPLTWRM